MSILMVCSHPDLLFEVLHGRSCQRFSADHRKSPFSREWHYLQLQSLTSCVAVHQDVASYYRKTQKSWLGSPTSQLWPFRYSFQVTINLGRASCLESQYTRTPVYWVTQHTFYQGETLKLRQCCRPWYMVHSGFIFNTQILFLSDVQKLEFHSGCTKKTILRSNSLVRNVCDWVNDLTLEVCLLLLVFTDLSPKPICSLEVQTQLGRQTPTKAHIPEWPYERPKDS